MTYMSESRLFVTSLYQHVEDEIRGTKPSSCMYVGPECQHYLTIKFESLYQLLWGNFNICSILLFHRHALSRVRTVGV